MPFVAKSAMPCQPSPAAKHPVLDEAAAGGSILLTAPPAYLLSEGLAAALDRQGRQVAWARLGPEDQDPGMLLASLIAAVQHLMPGFGTATLEVMRARPGPVVGWPLTFSRLAAELADSLPTNGALVLEHIHHLDDTRPTLTLLGRQVLPALPESVAFIATSHRELPAAALPTLMAHRRARDLAVPAAAASALLEQSGTGLPGGEAAHVATLCQGQAGTLEAVASACAVLGPRIVRQGIARATVAADLLAFLSDNWLATIGLDVLRALSLTLELEYGHPTLTGAALGGGVAPPAGPWLQMLSDGWSRIRTAWRAPLRSALAPRSLPSSDVLHRAADRLLAMGAAERAVPLYLGLGNMARAANVLAREADQLMDLGQWETLDGWLDRLPDRMLTLEPRLVADRAQIAAARGRSKAAKQGFSTAAALFAKRQEPDGACRSMLAESALAFGEGDLVLARERAQVASAMAEAAGLASHQARACWQLGTLACAAGELDDALVYFSRAAATSSPAGEQPLTELAIEAEKLARGVRDLEQERELQRQALLALDDAVDQAAGRLHDHLDAAMDSAALMDASGWLWSPRRLELASPEPSWPAGQETTGWWSRVRRAFAACHEGVRTDSLAAARPTLTAHLLGPLRVALNDVAVVDWPSGRGRSLLQYLLAHRDPWPSRELLMDVFWPRSAPEAARNSLNVAVHGLRRALRTAADLPVVILENGAYRLHPDLDLWLDIDEFDQHVGRGRQLQEAGELTGAMAEYEVATSVYQGDFLSDAPYEEWPALFRERLRLDYLDTLDRLSDLYASRARYAACAALCQRIIERDLCREDAHRRLMRCYSRQGQPHLALRQYRACVEALQAELGVDPTSATTQLWERIRHHQPV